MSPRRTSGVVVPIGGHRIDEGLIVSILIALSDECRLAVCFADEFGGVHIGNPDLNRPQSLLAQSLAILPYPVAGRCHTPMLHVTGPSACGCAANRPRDRGDSISCNGETFLPGVVATDLDTEDGGTDANKRDGARQLGRLNVDDLPL